MNKKDLLVKIHAYISADGLICYWKSKDMHGKKLRIRKRFSRIKFYNKNKLLINDFISAVKKVCPHLKYIRYVKDRSEVDIRSQILAKDLLRLGKVSTKAWEFPKDFSVMQKKIWISSFADCDGTVNNYNYCRYVAIDSINLKGLKQIRRVLEEFKISSRIIKVKYKENISYRLKIYRKDNMLKFKKLIGFKHPDKQKKLTQSIRSYKQKL